MSLACSNVLAVVAAVCLPIAGGRWTAPQLDTAERRCFFALTLWGVPFVVGQCAQHDKWGSLWVQYHLLDLSYTPWGTALAMCALTIGARWRGKNIPSETVFTTSVYATFMAGYATEVWDTAWACIDGQPFNKAFDTGDYTALTVGAMLAIMTYQWLQRVTPAVATS